MEKHANRDKRGVRVYFLMAGTSDIYSDVVEKQRGNRLEFYGGNWCKAADCFLTAGQCRRASGVRNNMVVNTVVKIITKIIDKLNDLRNDLELLLVEPR